MMVVLKQLIARAFLITLLLIAACCNISAQDGFVKVNGKQFVSPDGQTLFLKGINLGNWLLPEGYMFKFKTANSPRLIYGAVNELIGETEAHKFWQTYRENYITREDIRFIKKAGFNSVRIPFHYRLFVTSTTPLKFEGDGDKLLDRVIEWCKAENLYVVLDMHAAPGGQTGDNIDDSWGYPFLFEDSASQELMIQIWQRLAARYRNEKIIIGYDLLNEPIPHFFDVANLNPKLEPLYKRAVAVIRKVDAHHIIFLGGAQWDTNFRIFGAPFDDKLAYTFHKYWMTPEQAQIQEYVDFRDKYNVPVWLGESGENTDEWINSFRALLERNKIGWCFWPYKKLDATNCVVSIKRTTEWNAVVSFVDRPRTTFEEIRSNRPARETVAKALADFLENVKLKNCKVNEGYLKALGLTP